MYMMGHGKPPVACPLCQQWVKAEGGGFLLHLVVEFIAFNTDRASASLSPCGECLRGFIRDGDHISIS
jgi:hypothetical protein